MGDQRAMQSLAQLAAATIDEARMALLEVLSHDLRAATEMVGELAQDPRGLTHAWPITADARGMLRQVVRLVDALDDLGWAAVADGSGPASPLLWERAQRRTDDGGSEHDER